MAFSSASGHAGNQRIRLDPLSSRPCPKARQPVFVDFIRQLCDDLVRLKEAVLCRAEPR